MPRPLVYGNGSLLVALDATGVIRDLYYPHVGLYNHVNGERVRMGVWTPGFFGWLDGGGWVRELGYREGTLIGESTYDNPTIGLRLVVQEAVLPHMPVFLRRAKVTNLSPSPIEARLFFSQRLQIRETDIGDTALYLPELDGIVHYKGPFAFLFGASTPLGGLHEYATGVCGFDGMEGTWRDAEDGHLSMHPIAQGSVDSTFSVRIGLRAGGSEDVWSWVLCGDSIPDLTSDYHGMVKTGLDALLDEADQFWRTWLTRLSPNLSGLPKDIESSAFRGIMIMRTQVDHKGAVIAANDTDIMQTARAHYSSMWPRDGAKVADAFDRLGMPEVAHGFFEFCRPLISKEQPFFLQKYLPDGSLGASWHPWVFDGRPDTPFQQDETALTLSALASHVARREEWHSHEETYANFALPMAEFLVQHRDHSTHLPRPSYDLWEERRGVFTFTTATVVQALRAMATWSEQLGDDRSATFRGAAEETASALRTQLVDQDSGALIRGMVSRPGARLEVDLTPDVSVLLAFLVGALPWDSPHLKPTLQMVRDRLVVRSAVGGVARYEGDYYFRKSDEHPGNPWIICTMWLARSLVHLATSRDELEEPMAWLRWAIRYSAPSGVLPEQLHPDTGEHLSVSPLTWSHAEFLTCALDVAEKQAELG